MSPTSSAARTTGVCLAAGSATMTTTVGTTLTRRAAVCPPAQQEPSRAALGCLPSQLPHLYCHQAALGQVAPSQGGGQEPPPHPPTPCCVLEFVPFHLISCFSPFSHCPLGVAEVGVSDVPHAPTTSLDTSPEPPVPVLCLSPLSFTGLSLNPGACLNGLVPHLPFPYTVCPEGRAKDLCPLSLSSPSPN